MRTVLLIFILVWTINSFGQEDTTSIYYKALFYYDLDLDSAKSQKTEIFIENNNGITDKFPAQIGNRKVTILDWSNQKEVYNKNNNKIIHVKIFPARIKDNIIEIRFIPYFGEYKGQRKGYFLALSVWVTIQFKYDCVKEKFIYYKTTGGGI